MQTYRTRTTTLTEAEVLWLAAQAEDTTDYYAMLSDRVYGSAMASPDSSTIAELADGAAPGFTVRYGSADRHVAAQIGYAESLTGEHCVDGATHMLGDYSVWNVERTEGYTVVRRLHVAASRKRASEARTTRSGGRKPSCLCGDCTKCKARARKAKSRAEFLSPRTAREFGLPSIHADYPTDAEENAMGDAASLSY